MPILTIQPNYKFLESLSSWIWDRYGQNLLELSELTILLPSRRACRELKRTLLKHSRNNAVLLPKIKAVGDVDYDDLGIDILGQDAVKDNLDIFKSSSDLKYKLLLIKELMDFNLKSSYQFSNDISLVQATNLSLELEKLLNNIEKQRVDIEESVEGIDDYNQAEHWQKIITFLRYFNKKWKDVLKDEQIISVPEYRNKMISLYIDSLKNNPPKNPIIIAGVTGDIPVTTDLMEVLASYSNCYVILNGIDKNIDDDSWEKIDDFYPYSATKKLLKAFEADRSDVEEISNEKYLTTSSKWLNVLNHAFLPACCTDKWRDKCHSDESQNLSRDKIGILNQVQNDGINNKPHHFKNITLIETSNESEESKTISMILEETLQNPEKTACVITSDYNLTRRIKNYFQKYDININDAIGTPITKTLPASLIIILTELIESDFAPSLLLSLLKHPLVSLGYEKEELSLLVEELEIKVLRGVRRDRGFDWIIEKTQEISKNDNEDYTNLLSFINKLETFFNKLNSNTEEITNGGLETDLKDIISLYIENAEYLCNTPEQDGKNILWNVDEGAEEVYDFFSNLIEYSDKFCKININDVSAFITSLMQNIVYKQKYGYHPRLYILSPMEARLVSFDTVIIPQLNENSFPKYPDTDPWMNRYLRQEFGLKSDESVIGNSAYDFINLATAEKVYFTRSLQKDNIVATKSRFLLRLEGVLGNLGYTINRDDNYSDYIEKRQNLKETTQRLARPNPKPPLEKRPRVLSATRIEKLIADPYQIYVQKVLNLKKIDDLELEPSFREFGNFIHNSIEDFCADYWGNDKDLQSLTEDNLLDSFVTIYGERNFAKQFADNANNRAMWWPRFLNIAKWFVENEISTKNDGTRVFSEIGGSIHFDQHFQITQDKNKYVFTITAKADRIEILQDGSVRIIDYKTGPSPSESSIMNGKKPQMPIEALIAKERGFYGINSSNVKSVDFIEAKGKKDSCDIKSYPSVKQNAKNKDEDLETLRHDKMNKIIKDAEQGLQILISRYLDEKNGYICVPNKDPNNYNDYEHLERVDEWNG